MMNPIIDDLQIERTQAPMVLVLGETGAGKSMRYPLGSVRMPHPLRPFYST